MYTFYQFFNMTFTRLKFAKAITILISPQKSLEFMELVMEAWLYFAPKLVPFSRGQIEGLALVFTTIELCSQGDRPMCTPQVGQSLPVGIR